MNNRTCLLFLDDSLARHSILKSWLWNFDAAFNYEQATSMLAKKHYDVISLDHDLSEEDSMVDPKNPTKERTGSDVAKFIAANKIVVGVAILHSYNDAGAKNMADILKKSARQIIRIPFGFNAEIYRSLADSSR